jgi:hypothetical protein
LQKRKEKEGEEGEEEERRRRGKKEERKEGGGKPQETAHTAVTRYASYTLSRTTAQAAEVVDR